MHIDLFGPPRLVVAGISRQLSSRKAMAFLAYLAMRAGEPVTRQHLADLLWPDTGAEQARVNLRQCLAQVKGLLGQEGAAAIGTAHDQITLDPALFDIPARAVIADAAAGHAAEIAAGPGFLEGFSVRAGGFDTWAAAQRHRIEARLADALERQGKDRLAAGDPAGAAHDLALALTLDPFRETAHRLLMRAQAASGKTAAALGQFETCRAVLKDQLGVEPDAETRGLAAQIRASRIGRPQTVEPLADRFDGSPEVVVFGQNPQGGAPVEVHRGSAAQVLQAALETLRADPRGFSRLAAVEVADTATGAAAAVLARQGGAGLVVTQGVFRLFEAWSPFSFAPVPGDGGHYLLLGEMPRHRLQVAPTTSRPDVKFAPGNSVVVLPFRDHSPEAGRLDLGEVISEEIIARLARFRLLKVAGPTAGKTCRALGLSNAQVHERLGVKYAVEGSVARIGERLVITYSITDLAADRLVHGDKFEGRFADLFEQQSVLIDRIASTLFNRTEEAQMQLLSARLTNDIGAYELYLSGLSSHRRGGISTRNAHDAVRRFDEAIGVDPDFVRAHAYRICAMSWYAPVESEEIGFRQIDRLGLLDENDPEIHRIAGALHQIAGESDLAVAHLDKAVELNPSDAYLLASSAVYRAYAGDGDGALRQIERAMAVDPFLPAWCVEDHGVVLYAMGDHAGAVQSLRRLPSPSPRALAYQAAALVAQGDIVAAQAAVGRIKRASPDYGLDHFLQHATFKQPEALVGLRNRLGQAGLI